MAVQGEGRLEAAIGLEPTYTGFADQGMTTLPRRSENPPLRRAELRSFLRHPGAVPHIARLRHRGGQLVGMPGSAPGPPAPETGALLTRASLRNPAGMPGRIQRAHCPGFIGAGVLTSRSPGADGDRGSKAFDAV